MLRSGESERMRRTPFTESHRKAAVSILVAGLAGCASSAPERVIPREGTVARPEPLIVPSAADSAPEIASASPPIAPERTPVVPPERLPDFDPSLVKQLDPEGIEKLEIAASICGAAVRHDQKKLVVGCRSCPPFDSRSGPDGKVVVDPSEAKGEYFYPIEHVYHGSFTAAGVTEAAVVFTGCEPHAGNYGGTMLVGKPGNVWVAKTYRSGFHPDACKTFTLPDSRQILVCDWETNHQGFVSAMVDTYDFARGSDEDIEVGWSHVMSVDTNAFASCMMGAPTDVVQVGQITEYHFDTATADRAPRLVVTTRSGGGKRTRAFNAKCAELVKEIEKENPREIDLVSSVAASKKAFFFRWDKTRFVPDEATKKALKALGGDETE